MYNNTEDNTQSAEDKAVSKTSKIAGGIILGIFAVICLISSIYTITETETAVITTFGAASENTGKGLQFKIPFIQHVKKVDTTVKGFTIGYSVDEDDNTVDVNSESIMITSDYNFIDVDYYISYEVKDPIKYLYAADKPELVLKNIAMNSIRSTLSAYSVDAALTTGKAEIQYNVKQLIISELENEDIGISLVDASMQDVEPPTEEVNAAFKAVETAKQDKESAINEANQYRNEQIPAAEASADKIVQEATATKTARINEATGQASRFEAEYAQYKIYPLITKQRMFYETMQDVLPNLKIVIDDGSGTLQKYYPVESFANINAGTTTDSTSN